MEYPRLLIINKYSFNQYKGGGITLRNLFIGWPIDKIAIAHLNSSDPLPNICMNYYRFGIAENHYIFPLNKLSHERAEEFVGSYSSKITLNTNRFSDADSSLLVEGRKGKFRHNVLNLINKTGIYDLIHPIKMSKSFFDWVNEFNPDIVYCQPEDISFFNFILSVKKIFNVKIVIHFMDDWPSIRYNDKLLKPLLRLIMQKKIRKLLECSSLRLGISELMADEYSARYNLPFSYFHNPIDLIMTNKSDRNFDKYGSGYNIVYSGRIGITACYSSIIDFCKCIEALNDENFKVSFTIYTDLKNGEIDFSKFNYKGTYLKPALNDTDFMIKLFDADLLFYPVDFDDFSIRFIRLSFPTKLPAYFISNTPILVYGPESVYSIKFVIDNKLGFSCIDNNISKLRDATRDALTNECKRIEYSNNASVIAGSNFNAKQVREKFHQAIAGCILENI